MTAHLFATDPSEPLSLLVSSRSTPEPFGRAECRRFEFTSRGDRVPGRLLLPLRPKGPHPLILLQHGIGGSKEAPYLDAAAPWVQGGAAVASIDFPLHGERASPKLTERLLASFAPDVGRGTDASELDEPAALLWIETGRQAVIDLRRAVDALSSLPEIDGDRVAYAGFSLGSILGATFFALDPRLRAAALALGGGGFGPAPVDPCNHIARSAPRPLLFVNAIRDQRIPREASEALFAAAGEPKRIEWFEGTHRQLPGVALKAMWQFLRSHLDLSATAAGG